jgi:hypothetical protein
MLVASQIAFAASPENVSAVALNIAHGIVYQ